ncbi:MAG: hypothetical protein HYS32_03395 [Candidatus Woesearchaeota archaeon]|nr:MAG: hypothetical protein HYS32_03395 [Candidatus Woesearchaeota archaeon]
MKKGVLLILIGIFLLIIPSVFAEINLDGPPNSVYNIGDTLSLSGYILRTESVLGTLKLNLVCTSKVQLLARTVDIIANKKYIINENFPIPSGQTGDCTIEADLSSTQSLETKSSKSFKVTTDLEGSFNIDKSKIQLGDSVRIKGQVTRKNNAPVNGVATIFLRQDTTNVFTDTVNIDDASLFYVLNPKSIPGGSYSIDVSVTDIFGNKQLFSGIGILEITDQLVLATEFEVLHGKANQEVIVAGDVNTLFPEAIGQAQIRIELGDLTYTPILNKGKFSQPIKLPSAIKSGEHLIKLIVIDQLGNHGEKQIKLVVDPIPGKLENKLNKQEFSPKQTLEVEALLYDQAGDLYKKTVSIEIIDPEGKEVLKKVVQTEEKVNYEFPQFATPGNWKVISYSEGLHEESTLPVSEVSRLDILITGSVIAIKNLGNSDYKQPIEITLKQDDKEVARIVKKTTIDPEEEIKVYLPLEVRSGTYDIEVLAEDQREIFKAVNIVGGLQALNPLHWILPLILFAIEISYLILKRKPLSKRVSERDREIELGKTRAKQIRDEKKVGQSDSLSGWRKNVHDYHRLKEDDKKGGGSGGLMGMFD